MVGFANLSVILPAVSRDLALNETQSGLLGGTLFAAYALGVPLLVPLTDRFPPLLVYCLGSAFWIGGGVLSATAESGLLVPVLGRLLSGLGMAATYMPGMILLIERVPDDYRARAASTYTSCITAGTAFCFAVTGLVVIHLPWRSAFWSASLAAALASILVLAAVSTSRAAPRSAANPDATGGIGFLFDRRVLGWLAAFAGNSWEGMAFRTWWISFLLYSSHERASGESIAYLAIATAASGFLAMPISVFVARRARGGNRARIVAGVAVASGLFALLPPLFADYSPLFGVAITTLYMCFIFADSGTLPAALLDEIPASSRGLGLAAAATVANAAAFLGTAAAGAVINHAGGTGSSIAWLTAFITMGAGSIIGGITVLLCDDRKAVRI